MPLTGGAVAVYNSSGLAYYRHSDWLGSSRFASTPARTMYSDGAYAPFGEPYAQSGTSDLSFTGMNQDTVSGLYDFAAREYGTQGRWPSPDPAGLAAVSISGPQTWNRYAYVSNGPLHAVDPSGLKDVSVLTGEFGVDVFSFDGMSMDGPSGPTIGEGNPDQNPDSVFYQGSTDMANWITGDVAATPTAAGMYPDQGKALDALLDPCTGECRFDSIVSTGYDPLYGDPCVFGTQGGNYTVDQNSDPSKCRAAGGVWVGQGQPFKVSKDGTVTTVPLQQQGTPSFSPKVCQVLDWGGGYVMMVGFNPFIDNNPLVFATTVIGAGMWFVGKFGNC